MKHDHASFLAIALALALLLVASCRSTEPNATASAIESPASAEPYPLGPEMTQLERDLGTEEYQATILSWHNFNDLDGEIGRADLPDNARRFAAGHGGLEEIAKDPELQAAYDRRRAIHEKFLALMEKAYAGLDKSDLFVAQKERLEKEASAASPEVMRLPPPPTITPILSSPEAASQWSCWRGPSGQGHSAETGLPSVWNVETGEGIAWRTPIPGKGNSSPVIWDDRIYLTSWFEDGNRRALVSVRRSDGELLWVKDAPETPPEKMVMMKNGWASATPAVDGERVVTFFGNTGLVAFSLDGEVIWHRPLPYFDGTHGTAASPVIYRDLVILFQEHNRGTSRGIAVDKATGEVRWQLERPAALGWCTPLPLRVNDRDEMVYGASHVVIGYDPATGTELWTCSGPTREVIPTVVYANGFIYSCSGRNGPTLAIRPGGNGDVTATHRAWRVVRGAPHVPSPVVVGDLIHFANDTGILTCLDAFTGSTVYQKRLRGKFTASPIAGDGKLYFTSERGETFVIRQGREPEIISENPFGETTLASMAVLGGRLYARTEAHLVAIE